MRIVFALSYLSEMTAGSGDPIDPRSRSQAEVHQTILDAPPNTALEIWTTGADDMWSVRKSVVQLGFVPEAVELTSTSLRLEVGDRIVLISRPDAEHLARGGSLPGIKLYVIYR